MTAERLDSLIAEHRQELLPLRTLKLKNPDKRNGNAAFFVLLRPAEADLAKGEAVKFLSGTEILKDMSDALHASRFFQTFPDTSAPKILRREILSCTASAAECTFVLDLPEDVRSID